MPSALLLSLKMEFLICLDEYFLFLAGQGRSEASLLWRAEERAHQNLHVQFVTHETVIEFSWLVSLSKNGPHEVLWLTHTKLFYSSERLLSADTNQAGRLVHLIKRCVMSFCSVGADKNKSFKEAVVWWWVKRTAVHFRNYAPSLSCRELDEKIRVSPSSLDLTVRFLGNQQKLEEVTVPGQEIVWHITPLKTASCHFNTVFSTD